MASALVLVLLGIMTTRLTFTHTHTQTHTHSCIYARSNITVLVFKDGFMLLVYLMLSIVTICVTIVAICKFCFSSSTKRLLHCIRNSLRICWPNLPDFHLNSEDYRWWWLSFLSGGSSSVYVFLYAVYYFFAKTHMHGFLQISFYFGYTALFCFGLFLVGGTIGHMGSRWFVTRIYSSVKIE